MNVQLLRPLASEHAISSTIRVVTWSALILVNVTFVIGPTLFFMGFSTFCLEQKAKV